MNLSLRHRTAAALCLMWLMTACNPEQPPSASTLTQAAPEKATPIKTQRITAQDLEEPLSLPGSLEAWEDLTLAAEIAGPIDWVGPPEGADLKSGQAILTIDSVSQRANLEKARVEADVKQAAMQRLERLVADKLVSQQEHENSQTAYESARQNFELARIALDKSTVRSPIDGILDRRLVERGEYIKAGDPVALVVQVDRLKVLVNIPEKDIRYLHTDEQVQVIQTQIDTGDQVQRPGRVVHLAYKADPLTRTYRGTIEVDNHDGQLRPGMIVRVEALRRRHVAAIAIPLYAVVDLDGRKVAFVEEQGKAVLRPLRIDRVIDGLAVVSEGLELNQRLIVKGQQLLTDGATVKIEDN